MPHFRYRLLDESGNDLGPLATQRSVWSEGERLSRWHGDQLEVVNVVEAEEGDPFHGYLIVRNW
jgi:hypothetical protein